MFTAALLLIALNYGNNEILYENELTTCITQMNLINITLGQRRHIKRMEEYIPVKFKSNQN